jgi:DNA (cytosine-5)-methyltransferase 1
MSSIISMKLKRIHSGHKPRVLDLFAGCGGISLGFHAVGFNILGAVEIDPVAVKSHALNFHSGADPEVFSRHALSRDITITGPSDLMRDFGLQGCVDGQVDVLVGGPPCQAFARIGRAKLREIAEHPEAYLKDPRGNLYLRYLDYVKALKPISLLIENVPDMLNYGGHNIAEEVSEALTAMGYNVRYTLLNAVYYGVPEMRERMFLLAYHHEISVKGWFPDPTHWTVLPKGYTGTRQVAMQTIRPDLFNPQIHYVEPPKPVNRHALSAVTAYDALSDLAPITDHLHGRMKKEARHFCTAVAYAEKTPANDYQRTMRQWPGFEANGGVKDHVIRYLPRDFVIFRHMKAGDQYPEAHKVALRLLDKLLNEYEKEYGKYPPQGSEEYEKLRRATVPPYDPGKFPNKWRKMESDKPARTLMAHLGKDSYSHIHYDSAQARTISVREAARLQSFPDGFVFVGPMNPAFRQIGNAVPPLMSKVLALQILKQLMRSS